MITEAGGTARLVSKYRSKLNVVAVTVDSLTARQLTTSFGLLPYHYDKEKDSSANILQAAMRYAVK